MTKAYRIFYTPDAHEDIRRIYSHIAFRLREKRTASGQIDRIRKEVASLKNFPERYSTVDWEPWASVKMRKMSVDNYVVYYQVDTPTKTVAVARIVYGGRDMEHIISTDWD